MSLLNRAAQLAPFASLTRHKNAIQETARLTNPFIELDENKKEQLNGQLQLIKENLGQKPECEITYFRPDAKKEGRTYVTICGRIKKIDEYLHQIIFTDGTVLLIEHIFSIKGELFQDTES